MGIRFFCHSCRRKLNVKRTQAGLEGVCPHCRQSVYVPNEHPTEQTIACKPTVPDQQATLSSLAGDELSVDQHPRRTDLPLARSIGNSNAWSLPDDRGGPEPFGLGKPSAASITNQTDPIGAEPDKIWYYRLAGRGERGPLKAKKMQAELDRGAIPVGAMVWREDWPAWLPVEDVFNDPMGNSTHSKPGFRLFASRSKRSRVTNRPFGLPSSRAQFLIGGILFVIGLGSIVVLICWLFLNLYLK